MCIQVIPSLWLLFLFSLLEVNSAFSSVGKLSSDLGGVPRTDKLVSWNHAQVSMSSSTAQRLWAESSSTAFRCLYHPFVSGLALGNLPVRTFQHYIGNRQRDLSLVINSNAMTIYADWPPLSRSARSRLLFPLKFC